METQLVRLDKPYSIICGKKGEFALHIATLIVVDGYEEDPGDPTIQYPIVKSYPVVRDDMKNVDGFVWNHNELKDCLAVCRVGDTVSLHDLNLVMTFLAKKKVTLNQELTPTLFLIALRIYGAAFHLQKDDEGNKICEYKVELLFEEGNDGDTCMVYSTLNSLFYFYQYFSNDPSHVPVLPTNLEAISLLAKYRNNYLRLLKSDGLKSIKFITKDKQYQWFVDKLNDISSDGKRV